jgi:hypothetical protein
MKQIDDFELDEHQGQPPLLNSAVHTTTAYQHRHNHANPPNAQMVAQAHCRFLLATMI